MRLFLLSALLVFMSGCAMKELEKSQAYAITLKTPQWKFADTGFVREDDDTAGLEVFVASKRVLELQISKMVCVEDEGCMSKSAFNAKYLSASYGDNLLYNLLKSRPLMGGRDLVVSDDGFEQRIFESEYDIVYIVDSHGLYFRDRENEILIKLRKIN